MINKENILNKTHYGLHIYSHILSLYYPGDVVLRLVGRDCGKNRNPFNAHKETLHIYIEKSDPTNVLSEEFARHADTTNAIPAGDAIDFAELHYKQNGDELLQTLNKELNLKIGQQQSFYKNKPQPTNSPYSPHSLYSPNSLHSLPKTPHSHLFSFFKAPITNIQPHKTVNLLQIYNAIKGNYYKQPTEKLRKILASPSLGGGQGEVRKFKASNFDYCTFSGTFTTRNDKALIKHSGLLCIDFDQLQSIEKLRNQLLHDEYFDTQLLFRSPSGNGLKWIIAIDTAATTHSDYFAAVANYILQTYGIVADKSGRDISRACFLPHDPQAYINPSYLK